MVENWLIWLRTEEDCSDSLLELDLVLESVKELGGVKKKMKTRVRVKKAPEKNEATICAAD